MASLLNPCPCKPTRSLRLTLSLAAGGELVATPLAKLADQLGACVSLLGRRAGNLPCAPAVKPLALPEPTLLGLGAEILPGEAAT